MPTQKRVTDYELTDYIRRQQPVTSSQVARMFGINKGGVAKRLRALNTVEQVGLKGITGVWGLRQDGST